MQFQRVTIRRLPNGELEKVVPFHVCTEGQEDRVIFRTEEDLRVAHNFMPICARRANVILLTDCELNTHVHAAILARSYVDALHFIHNYKKSTALYLSRQYSSGIGYFRGVDARPILLEDIRHVRNVLCYIPRNSLDVGVKVDEYTWSGYRAMFRKDPLPENPRKVSDLSTRERRRLLKVDDDLRDTGWIIDENGIIEPFSYCDTEYAEAAFFGNVSYFTKIMGMTDNEKMDQMMVKDHLERKSVEELLAMAEERALSLYKRPLSAISEYEKISIIKSVYYATRATYAQLARCFGLPKDKIEEILKYRR